jgi:glutamine amidotransferase
MGALVAILQSDPNLLRCQVRRLDEHVALREAASERLPDAYGFGYYKGNDVLLGKRPSGAPRTVSLSQLAGAVDSDALLVHARTATVGALKDENTHPFRFRRWLFAHDGTVEGFREVKPRLLEALPEFLRRNVEGDTDSEHAFMLFLKYVREGGHLDDLDVEARVVGRALARVTRDLETWTREAGAGKPCTLNFVATNGRVLAATRRGRPLHYALLEGIVPCKRDGLEPSSPESDPRVRPHRQVKAVCFATWLRQANGFLEVPEASVVAVGRTLQVSVSSLSNA